MRSAVMTLAGLAMVGTALVLFDGPFVSDQLQSGSTDQAVESEVPEANTAAVKTTSHMADVSSVDATASVATWERLLAVVMGAALWQPCASVASALYHPVATKPSLHSTIIFGARDSSGWKPGAAG